MENYYNNQPMQQAPTPPQKPKKKGCGCLTFILCFFFVIALIIGGIFAIGKITRNQMEAFMPEHPYVLHEDDTRLSVQNDFTLPKYIIHEGKEKAITWKANNDVVAIEENGDVFTVSVTAPSKPSKVILTATYKMLLIGKAEKTYEIQVLPESTIETEDVYVVDIETVKDKTYDENMTMVLREDGTVASMYGDFQQKVYHSGDALVVLNAYKTELGFDTDIEFIEKEVIADEITTYLFAVSYNGIPIENSIVYMSVNNNFELNSIKCNFNKDISKYKNVENLPKEQTIDILGESLGRTGEDTIAAIADKRYEEINGKTCLVVTYVLFYDNGEIHSYEVNETDGVVIGEVINENYLSGIIDGIQEGAQTIADAMITDATGKGVHEDKKLEVSHIGPLHLLYHPTKNIAVYTSTMDIPGFLYTLVTNKMVEWGIWLGDNTKIPVIPDLMQVLGVIDGLVYSGVETLKSVLVCDVDNYFNVPLTEPAVEAYHNITLAYDYYQNRFNRWSYDNKGAPIRVFTNFDHSVGSQFDNACWQSLFKCFYVYPAKDFDYSLAAPADVLGHEYTHAVFGSYASGEGEVAGINEAYADTFAILMSHPDSWKIGKNASNGTVFYIRDLENINSPESAYTVFSLGTAPEKYHDECWDSWNLEEHAISCILTNIAYKMYNSGHFSKYELESIWYKSLTYGYSGEDTYVTCRQQILQAMKELNFSAEQRDYVRTLFDDAEIFDYTDIYECEPEPTPEEIAYEELLEKLNELNLEGDSVHRYAIMISPIGFALNKVPFYIYEESNNPSTEEEEIINQFLNQYWVSIGGAATSEEIGEYVGQREGNAIEYKQVSPLTMDMIEFIFGKAHTEITDIVNGALSDGDDTEEEQSIITTIINLIFVGNVNEMSRQDFFEGVIEE